VTVVLLVILIYFVARSVIDVTEPIDKTNKANKFLNNCCVWVSGVPSI